MFKLSDFLIYCFVTAYTPGINNLLSMSNAARLGFYRSLWFNIGITVGFLIVMSSCTLFSAYLSWLLPQIRIMMQTVGALYMIYLAVKILNSSVDIDVKSNNEANFIYGMIIQFINPKVYIYAITAMNIYIQPVYNSTISLVIFTCILTIIGSSATFVWALFGSTFCIFFINYRRIINSIMSILLLYCAISLFL